MWSNLALKKVCRKINHHEYDCKTTFILVLAYDYLESFVWTVAGKERREVLEKELNK